MSWTKPGRACAVSALLAATLLLVRAPGSLAIQNQPRLDSSTQPTAYHLPTYDSGWVEIPPNDTRLLHHNLGGNPENYVVDVQFWDISETGGDVGVHNWGYGADFSSQVTGLYWQELTSTDIHLARTLSDTGVGAVRVRIRVMPDADYDSGWRTLDTDQDLPLTHNLGGDPDDYVVDMQFKSSNPHQGVNQLGYGGDRWLSGREEGAFWHSLDATSIHVKRNTDDASASRQVRIRIWRQPSPDYDSGWQPIDDVIHLTHDLGGPWNDFFVDLQMEDTTGSWGVHQMGYGGDVASGVTPKQYGAYWTNLTANTVQVHRGEDDDAIDQVRVRIWASRMPHYDSGWVPFDQNSGQVLSHNLGGTTFPYVVDVQFRDTIADGISGAGVNQQHHGGDTWYNHSTAQHVNRGVWWHSLTDESLFVYRFGEDYTADEVRARLWIAPDADYDSGWQNISTSLTFNHNLGGDPDDYVVDLQFNDNIATYPQGINQGRYGGDTFFENGAISHALGGYWDALDGSSITVRRLSDASLIDAVRVRIWANKQFDYAGEWESLTTIRTVHHNLAVCTDGMVVDLQFKSDGTAGVHHQSYGGNSIYFGRLYQYGAYWQVLTGNTLELYRQSDDHDVDQARVRIWNTPGCRSFLPLIQN